VKLNAEKSKLLLITHLREKINENLGLQLFNDVIRPVSHARFLGIEYDDKLTFRQHLSEICGKANKRLNVLRDLARAGTRRKILMSLYKMYVHPLFEYGSISFIAA
jgi:hypothetical protein